MSLLSSRTEVAPRAYGVGSRRQVRHLPPPSVAPGAGAAEAERRYFARLVGVDAAVALAAASASYLLRFGAAAQPEHTYLALSLAFPLVWVLAMAAVRSYQPRFLYVGTEEFRRVVQGGLVLTVVAALTSYALKFELARGFLMLLVVFATAGTLLLRYALRSRLQRLRSAGSGWMRRVLVAGHDDEVRQVLHELGRTRGHGYQVAGVCVADAAPGRGYDLPMYEGLDNIDEAAAQTQADAVVVLPCHHLESAAMRRLGWRLERSDTDLLVGTGLLDVAQQRTTVHPVGSLPLLHVDHAELRGARRVAKGVMDRLAAAFGLLLAGPLLLVLMAAVRLDSPGPALFRQQRVGRGNDRFTMLKLRTMTVDAEERREDLVGLNESDGALFKIRNDPRITRVGRLLRRFSLDELPQLVNVLRGEMSLVGPRPPLPAEVADYEYDVRRRLAVKPGLTGLWQVSGRSDLPWDEAVRLDLRYVDNWSPLMDLQILFKTGRAVLSRSGAY
jgi:exopolysaccharide biosynthesis polyprenyl glycosylphosphotransferase